jgi:hypothetical protein
VKRRFVICDKDCSDSTGFTNDALVSHNRGIAGIGKISWCFLAPPGAVLLMYYAAVHPPSEVNQRALKLDSN